MKVFCLDESLSYDALASGDDPVPTGKELVGFKIPRWTEQLAAARLVDYGLWTEAQNFYRQEPILFLLRDVRDVVASMVRLRQGGTSWLEAYGIPVLKSKIADPAFRTRFARELNLVEKSNYTNLPCGALYWKCKTSAFFEYLALQWPVLGISCENLTREPELELKRTIEFLGIGWEPALWNIPGSRMLN